MWFIYALLGAVGKSYSGFFRKKIAKSVSSVMYIWVAYTLILVAFTPFMVFRFSEISKLAVELPIIILGAVVMTIGTILLAVS